MPNIENYLGYPTFNHESKQWEVFIDDNLETNLNCICELAVTIFDAKACRIVGVYPQSFINIAQYGNLNVFDNKTDLITLPPTETVEKEVTPTKNDINKAFQILSPILSILESTAVYIELYRNTNLPLTNKDKKALHLITSDIKNHLLQQQVIIKDNKEKEDVINQLKSNNNELNDFTRIASHDLKSPLNAIRRLLEWIEEDCRDILPKESLNNLHLIVSRANRMHTLLDDLLSFSKIGHQDTKIIELSTSQLLDDIIPLLDIPNNFTLNITDTESDAMLIVPLTPFKTVMLNVIGNAIKHNDKDNGIIDVSITDTPNDYIIRVSDNGPGIEPKHFERVFQLLQTLKSRDEVEGSGIGLSVVTKNLNIFGGKIDIESDGKLGATFNIYWPKN